MPASRRSRWQRNSNFPASGKPGAVQIDGGTFVIQGEPLADAERLVWTIEARSA